MNNIGINTNAFANLVTPFNPVAKQPIGQENPEAKGEVFAPVVEADEPVASQDRETAKKPVTNAEDKDQQNSKQQSSQQEEQQAREDQELIRELSSRDREVRAHEQAHAAVGGKYAGAPSYSFERGPDGVNYAVAGEVPISLPSSASNPEAALRAAEQVRRAALAPADPSSQDHRVAAQAAQMILEARSELANAQRQQRVEQSEGGEQQRQLQQEKDQLAEAREQERQEKLAATQQKQQEVQAVLLDQAASINEKINSLINIESSAAVGRFFDTQV
jgi:hypothetical protein